MSNLIAKSLCVDVPKTCTSDLLLVKENERIPADGLILSEAFVDESMITGESRAVKCKNCLDEIMLIMQNNSADSPRRVDAICGINQHMAYATIGKKWLAYS